MLCRSERVHKGARVCVPYVLWRACGSAQEAPCRLGRFHKDAMRMCKGVLGCANVQCGASTEKLGEGAQVGVIYPLQLSFLTDLVGEANQKVCRW